MMGCIKAPSPAAVCTPNQKAGIPIRGSSISGGTTMRAESRVTVSVADGDWYTA